MVEAGAERPADAESEKQQEAPAEPEVQGQSLGDYYQSVGVKKTQAAGSASGLARDEKKLEKFTNKNEKIFIKREMEATDRAAGKRREAAGGVPVKGVPELDALVSSKEISYFDLGRQVISHPVFFVGNSRH